MIILERKYGMMEIPMLNKKLMSLHLMHWSIGIPNQHDDKSTTLHYKCTVISPQFILVDCYDQVSVFRLVKIEARMCKILIISTEIRNILDLSSKVKFIGTLRKWYDIAANMKNKKRVSPVRSRDLCPLEAMFLYGKIVASPFLQPQRIE